MPVSYDLSTDVGRVRLLIPDRDTANAVFQDDEIAAFLALEGNVRRAAALALETIASDEALTQKVIRLLDLSTDGASLARALLQRAAALRQQADDADARDGALFDWAEMVVDDFSARERLTAEVLRRV